MASGVKRFEDLIAWQKARVLTKAIYGITRIAKGSCAEVRSQLYVALDAEYLDEKEFLQLLQQAEEVGRVVGGLRASVERYCNR